MSIAAENGENRLPSSDGTLCGLAEALWITPPPVAS
jgi:hypothetical protein